MDDAFVFWLIVWALVWGGFTSSVASSKGHDGVSWFLGGAFFGPLALLISFFLGQQNTFAGSDIDSVYRDAEVRARKYADALEDDRRRRRDHEELVEEMRHLRRSSRMQRHEDEEIMEMERSRRIRERYEYERWVDEEREQRLRRGLQDANYRDQYLSGQNRLINRFDEYMEFRNDSDRRGRRRLPPDDYRSGRESDYYLRGESVGSDEVIDIDSSDDENSDWR